MELLTEKRGLIVSPDRYGEWSDSDVKAEQRDRVLSHILKWHPRKMAMKYFGLPGSRWHAERILDSEVHSSRFVGCENRYGTIERGLPWMPGKPAEFYREDMRNGHIDCFSNARCRIVYFDVFDFLRLNGRFKASKSHRIKFSMRYKRWTCAWIDSWSPVGSQLRESLLMVGSFMDYKIIEAPLAVTFLIGRDTDLEDTCDEDPLGKRVKVIGSELSKSKFRSFVVDDAWTHESKGGIRNMGTVVGRMIRKQADG